MLHPASNTLLKALSDDARNELSTSLVPVALPRSMVLYEANQIPHYAYFPTSGMASVVANTPAGQCAEVGLIGREGVTAALHLLGSAPVVSQCFVQVEGSALRVPFTALRKAFDHSASVRGAVLAFVQGQSVVLEQLGACNLFHPADARLARWLLMVQDRVSTDMVDLTQEFLSVMLGSGRPTVTLACGALQKAGAIDYRRGHIQILSREKLQESACDCYGVAAASFLAVGHSITRGGNIRYQAEAAAT
ncbi:Crp/Fnr family transcriptional regulator [Acidipila sp. EB88]|uniref:Crp/Fnr family transcriptional regulator n=1 Tax=Acidipila sp. EB88 TaxID=2305226 RepID=UPI000F5E6716|nr:Crp/Fnr family transcriptional regulator [Acidipila sp. EB88]RRA49247.1 Crp/Fnr family transcriptional regulator [Acidipila sp. EB88]